MRGRRVSLESATVKRYKVFTGQKQNLPSLLLVINIWSIFLSVLSILWCLTWSVGLQVPGSSGASGLDGDRRGGINCTAGLHVRLLVPRCGDLQDRDGGALVQLPGGRQHLCEALLARADSGLQGAVQHYVRVEVEARSIRGVLGQCLHG